MEESHHQGYWVIWYPSYTHKDFELINSEENQPLIEDLTDSYFEEVHTYLKIETDHSGIPKDRENIRLSFYQVNHKKNIFFKILVFLFRNGVLKDRPITLRPIENALLIDDNLIAKINLIYKKHSSNGLFVYECVVDENSGTFSSEDDSLLSVDKDQYPTFYYIKQLYHTHLFHRKSKQYKDYYFRAFLTPDEPNIAVNNNDSLKFFLEKILEYYEFQLKHFEEIKTNTNADTNVRKRQIDNSIATLEKTITILQESMIITTDKESLDKSSSLIEILKKEIKKRKKEKESLITLSKNKKDKQNLFVISNDIVGETLFTNALCRSKYLDRNNENFRKLLLNIENVNMGLQYVRDNYRYWYDEQISTKSIKATKLFGRIGYFFGIIGVISLLFSFYSYNNPKVSNQNNNSKIIKELKSINSSLINVKQNLDSINISRNNQKNNSRLK